MAGHLIGVTGLPGTGKSHFARSARDVGKTLVALTDPKETSFYGDAGVTVFADLDWRPHLEQYSAEGATRFLRWLAEAEKSDAPYIVVDTGSELSDLAMHEVLKVHGTNDPRDVEYGRAYTSHDQMYKTIITEFRRLVVRGKTVIVTFHGMMKELEGAGDAKKGKAMSGELEWKFDEQMLPAIGTSYRQRVHSAFDLWLYTVPVGFGSGRQYFLTALADQVRPAKHSVTFKPAQPGKPAPNLARIPNTLKALLDMLDDPKPSAPPTATPATPKP